MYKRKSFSKRSKISALNIGALASHSRYENLNPDLARLRDDAHLGSHYLTPSQLETVFNSDIKDGLSEEAAQERLQMYGLNEISEHIKTDYCDMFRRNLFGWFQCFLWICAILTFLGHFLSHFISGQEHSNEHLFLGIIICLTIVGTGLFAFYQEAKNIKLMSGFEQLVPPEATVLRDGVKRYIPSSHLVIGDIIEMVSGELVPADVRLLAVTNFKTDMASLTGETVFVNHTVDNTHDNFLESKNMAFFSCPVTEGWGQGIVIATGTTTEIGRIAGLVTALKKEKTPIAKELAHFIKILCVVAFVFGTIFFIVVFVVQKNIISAFHYMLGIVLANVPEGLILTLTICMTLSAKKLKSVQCLAKTLQAVETLGSTSCICTDKTGTLTQNRMSVSHLYFDDYIMDKDEDDRYDSETYKSLCFAASLCLKANFDEQSKKDPIETRKIVGDASESAILRYMEKMYHATKLRSTHIKVAEIPFSSVYKYQVSIHQMPDESFYLVMKGAPEIILEFCSEVKREEGTVVLDANEKRIIKKGWIKLGQMGERVLGYCGRALDTTQFPPDYIFDSQVLNFELDDLTFLGLVALIDLPREKIEEAIQDCRQAGIRVFMVTGDHPITALAISRKVGIISMENSTAYDYAFDKNIEVNQVPKNIKEEFKAVVVTGDDLRSMTTEELRRVISHYDEITFARTSPEQKLFIVETCQSLKYIVAVTGDGVNDSPALKKADIGVAMGINGTDVTKKAADMVLLDDNFTSIVMGIKEGRRIWDNLKKTIAYTLTSNTPEMLPFILYSTIGIPLPLSIMLIIVINIGTDILPAMSLAYETPEMDIMHIPPRKSTDHLVTKAMIFMTYFQVGLIQAVSGLYAYFTAMAVGGFFPHQLIGIKGKWYVHGNLADSFGKDTNFYYRQNLECKAQTAYFFAIVLSQVSDVIICKTRRISIIQKGMRNHVLNIGILVELVIAMLVIYTPPLNYVLNTRYLEWYLLLCGIPFSILMIVLDELRRYLIRKNKCPWIEEETYY